MEASEIIQSEKQRTQTHLDHEDHKASDNRLTIKWIVEGNCELIYGDCNTRPSDKILAIDFDHTLVKPKSGARFSRDENDWMLLNDKVVSCLQYYSAKDYKIVIVTNQGGIEMRSTLVDDIQKKIQKAIELIDIPMQVLIAPKKKPFQKAFS